MTLEEARTIARIIGTANNGDRVCVDELLDQLEEAFPQFQWGAGKDIYPNDEQAVPCAIEVSVSPA